MAYLRERTPKQDQEGQSLRSDISNAIAPWTKVDQFPPYSTAELATIGCALRSIGYPSTMNEIFMTLVRRFRGIDRLAAALKTRNGVSKIKFDMQLTAREMDSVIPNFTSVLCYEYYLPLHDTKEFVDYDHVGHTACVPSARIFLAKCLGKTRPEPFRLLDLPKELRLTIYEYALTLPQLLYRKPKGVKVSYTTYVKGQDPNIYGDHQYVPTVDALRGSHRGFKLNARHNAFALLYVSKQVRAEALPRFYAVNHFCFSDVIDLSRFTASIASPFLKHLAHLSLIWDGLFDVSESDYQLINRFLERTLRNIPSLRTFTLDAGETMFDDHSLMSLGESISLEHIKIAEAFRPYLELAAEANDFQCVRADPEVEPYLRRLISEYRDAQALQRLGKLSVDGSKA